MLCKALYKEDVHAKKIMLHEVLLGEITIFTYLLNQKFFFYSSSTDPNPVDIANFEEIFEARGARKCWNPGRLTSPLALHYAFPANYERYCLTKTKIDKKLLLNSGYLQGTILTCPPKRSVSMN